MRKKLLVLSIMSILLFPIEVSATTDTSGPFVFGVTASPTTLELGEEVTITAHVTDESGVRDVGVQLVNAVGNVAGGGLSLISGDTYDGEYRGTFTIPTNTPAGTFDVDIYAHDIYGNWNGFGPHATFEVTGSVNDTSGPHVFGVTASPTTLELGEEVTITAHVTDESGVRDVGVQLVNAVGNVAGGGLSLISGDTYSGTFTIPLNTPSGTFDVDIYAHDIYGNWNGFGPHATFEATEATIKDIRKVSISRIHKQRYTGREIEPYFTLKYNDLYLTEGRDYTVFYKNNVNVGTAKIKIQGMGYFEGIKEFEFEIYDDSINKPESDEKKEDSGNNDKEKNTDSKESNNDSELSGNNHDREDIIKSEVLPGTVLTGIIGGAPIEMKVFSLDGVTNANQYFLAQYYMKGIGKKAKILLSKNVCLGRELTAGENGILSTFTWKNLDVKQGQVVYAVCYNQKEHAYLISGIADSKGTVTFNNFVLRPATNITIFIAN